MENSSLFVLHSSLKLSQRLVEHVVNLVVAELLLEAADSCVLVDVDELNTQDLAEVLPVLSSDVVRESTVVSTTSEDPSTCTNLECWLWNPES